MTTADHRGVVFNIQRYSLHDGPGLRTIVFLKGCSMRCVWCENPESLHPAPQLAWQVQRCIECGRCEQICPRRSIDLKRSEHVDWTNCDNCGRCVEVCPSTALRLIGKVMSVEDVLAKVLRDREFYQRSGGGVTISGGEPTVQRTFLRELLQACKSEGLHTVLETNGLLPWERLEALTALVDIFYLDLKGLDPCRHLANTGADNQVVLNNARRLRETGRQVVFRLPLIPTLNAEPDQLADLGQFLDDLGATEVHLLPYHTYGEAKIPEISTRQRPLAIPEMSLAEAETLASGFTRPGRLVVVGGR